MITKKQWAQFCFDVQKVYGKRLQPFVHGKRVIDVDIYNNTITTSLEGQPKTKYTYESCGDITLRRLYRSVSLNRVTMADLNTINQ
jgi:hypothetical protein